MLRETEFVVVQNWEGGVRVLNPVPISIGNYFKLILRCATYYPDCDALGFHKISTYPLKQRSKRIIYRTDLGKWRIYLTHNRLYFDRHFIWQSVCANCRSCMLSPFTKNLYH